MTSSIMPNEGKDQLPSAEPVVFDPDGADPFHRGIGEFLLRPTKTPSAEAPPIVHDVEVVIGGLHAVADKMRLSPKSHAALQKAEAWLKSVLAGTTAEPASTLAETVPTATPVPDTSEKSQSRERWTKLSFQSASAEEAKVDARGTHGHDRVLDDSENGIWGVFDGVSSMQGAAEAAEITKRTVHETLLSAAKPSTKQAAKMLMYQALAKSRAELRRMENDDDFEGSTTANVSFAVEIDGKDYLVIGNAGDSVCYMTDENSGAKLVTTEQSNAQNGEPSMIFNSIGPHKGWNREEIERLPRRMKVPEKYYFDEIVIVPIKSGQRFVHATDGISGDDDYERLSVGEFAKGLQQDTVQKMVGWLFATSRKNDDKGAVAVIVT
jgi:serine/threonine protein phosphatase PrpC